MGLSRIMSSFAAKTAIVGVAAMSFTTPADASRGGAGCGGGCSDPAPEATPPGDHGIFKVKDKFCLGAFVKVNDEIFARIKYEDLQEKLYRLTSIGHTKGSPLALNEEVELDRPAKQDGCNERFQRKYMPSN